jgi:RNA recognition motif-containing protein
LSSVSSWQASFRNLYLYTYLIVEASIMSIYVGNLSYEVAEDDLKAVFAEYGEIKRVHLPIDRESGRPRGFAFVEMVDESKEDAAIEALDEAEWMGRALKVNKAKPREEGGSGGGGGRGGFRGGGGRPSGGGGGRDRY